MRFTRIRIKNFKSIRDMELSDIDSALILVGKNNTGKTSVLDAVRLMTGGREVLDGDFDESGQNIEIETELKIEEEDLLLFHSQAVVSAYRRFELWKRDFEKKLPSFQNGILSFTFLVNREGRKRFFDGFRKHNPYIAQVIPKLHYIDTERELNAFQSDLFLLGDSRLMNQMRNGACLFDSGRACSHCFQCIGLINQKKPEELNALEAQKLFEYKLYQLNLGRVAERINENFEKNGGFDEIRYRLQGNLTELFSVQAELYSKERGTVSPVSQMSRGMRCIYMLSLLETYVEEESQLPSIIVVEYPELFLHPRLQKTASEILYRLSKKNQVIFSTHSPQLLLNFTSRQIRQVVLDEEFSSVVRSQVDIGEILDDLGYGAGDVMNVDFVFIVEGRQDKSRLPLLLKKYYSEVYKEDGSLSRVSIITTNSCTNIKTYANLKYMNQVHFKDQFLMIRDGDGKDRGELKRQLCRYYEEQGKRDVDHLPRVTEKNVLILRYYSFENYFLNPEIMTKLSVVPSEEVFYDILYEKWREYLCRLTSGKKFKAALGRDLKSPEDLKEHMDLFKIHLRGHNLFDIFYGRYKKQETELLSRYIDLAPREDFADILDSIDQFLYFDSRKKKN
ncbi:MAG: AAA family ATPase [Clostridium sp.]|nr:AAA family ATPase [Clostridium sp.]